MPERVDESGATLVVDFRASRHLLSDVSVVLAALNHLVEASLWVEVCNPDTQSAPFIEARERLRQTIVGSWTQPDARLARLALFGEPYGGPEHRRRGHRLNGRDTAWTLSRESVYGDWLRRELDASDPDLYRTLAGFAVVERLQQQSPIKLRIGVAGVTTAAVVLTGPWGLAPTVLLGLYETALWARERWWQSQEQVAASKAQIAMSETAVVREELAQTIYRSVEATALPESVAEVAVRVALPSTGELASSPAIERLALERPAMTENSEPTDDRPGPR